MADETSPQLHRQELGARLREFRLSRDMTVDEVADRLLCSASKVSRLETGRRAASPRDVRDLCDIYGIEEAETREELMALAQGARRRRGLRRLGEGGGDSEYAELESTASGITICVASLIPALFQTEDYARAQLRGSFPGADDDWIEQRVRSFELRQRLLTRKDPPQVVAMIDESALHRRVGGEAVMRAQLDRLVRVSAFSNIKVHIVPFSAGAHEATESSFVLLDFDAAVPSMVYAEEIGRDRPVKRRSEVELYEQAVQQLRGVALDVRRSARFIVKIRDGGTC